MIRTMRSFALKTQFAIIVVFLVAFAFAASISNHLRTRAQSDLQASLHRDVAIATTLPRLKPLLRKLDLVTAQFLKTGDEAWIEEHKRLVSELQAVQAALAGLLTEDRQRRILQQLDRRLLEHFIKESDWIRAKRAGKLTAEETARILSARRDYEEVLEIALSMHDVGLEGMPGRLRAAEVSAWWIFAIVLLSGLLASALLAVLLLRYVFGPISVLAEYAASWRPGQPWDCTGPSVSPEINGLFERMKSLMESVNEEHRKERDLNRLKSQFVSLVSHELNNAISVIHAASANLEELDPDPKDAKREKMYRMIKGQTRTLSSAIANLLNAGRLESGRLALRKKKMEMAAVLRGSLELLEILYENKGLNVSLSLPETPVSVYADPDALTLVATNLLSNAIKYTPPGGSISVGLARESGHGGESVRVYFKDTGIGIKPEERERIFSGHYRSEAGQSLAKGFGIGLSLAKSIIEAHGGRLELESEPGKGSTFSFLLPVWIDDFDAKKGRTIRANGARETAVAAA